METAPIVSPFIDCHAEQHCWQRERWLVSREVGWTPPKGMGSAIGRLFTCTECGSQKARWYDAGRVKLTYHYVDDYLHSRTKDDQRPAPKAVDYRRVLVEAAFSRRGKQDEVAARRRKRRAS